jgi:hypothetical protein
MKLTRNRICAISAAVFIALTAHIISCSNAGSSEIGNPEKVAAIIVDSAGTGVPGVAVKLVPCDYYPMKDTAGIAHKPSRADTSDYAGKVLIQAPDTGVYNLVATSDQYKYHLYVTDILIQNKEHSEGDTLFLNTVPLREPGTVLVRVDSSVYTSGGTIVVIGSLISSTVQGAGVVAVAVPSGTVSLRYINSTGDSITGGPAFDTLHVGEGSMLDNTYIADTVTAPSLPVGPDTGVLATAYMFSSGGTVSNKYLPVQYRFDWGDAIFSAWSSDSSATHAWADTGVFIVTAQARGAIDTGVLSSFSSGRSIRIVAQHIVTAPQTPTGLDSVAISVSYSFSTGGAASSLGDQVQYRFSWGDTTYSAWSLDSTGTHSWASYGSYYISAQARSSTDTTVISGSSGIFTVVVVY